MTDKLREAAEIWLLNRFPEYQKDRSVMHVDIEVWTAGANYQKPITRQETIAEMVELLGSEEMREWYVNSNPSPMRVGDWLEEKLRAMEGKEK